MTVVSRSIVGADKVVYIRDKNGIFGDLQLPEFPSINAFDIRNPVLFYVFLFISFIIIYGYER